MSEYAIELSGVTFSYDGETEVLKGLDFQLPFGQFAVLQGISGTGKTTLLSVINDVIPNIVPGKLTGKVWVSGEDVAEVCATGPKVLFLDEPTVGQDYEHLKQMLDSIRTLQKESGCAVVTVAHDVRCKQTLSDKQIIMKQGRIIR